MADTSTTETGADQNSSGSQDESLLETQQTQTADEQQGTGSSDNTQDSGHSDDDGRQDDTTHDSDDSSDDDDGLAKFAKAQGFDLENADEQTVRALKLARNNQKAFHEERKNKSDETRKKLDELHQPDENGEGDFETEMRLQFAQLQAKQRLNDFYLENPEAKDYDADMAAVLAEETEKYGIDSARALAQNMPRLLREAKAYRGDNSAEAAREAGRREERTRIRKAQEGSSGGSEAAQHSNQGSTKITREWVTNEYDPNNSEHRKMLDEALAKNELY